MHQVLHFARHTLEPDLPARATPAYLTLRDEAVSLGAPEDVWTDVDAFEAAADAAQRGKTPEVYESAVALYGGDLLPDDAYEDWAVARREALRNSYVSLLLALAERRQAAGQFFAARDALERLMNADHLNEEAGIELMRLLARTGQRVQALRQYERLRELLHRELSVDPQPATQRLYEEILAGVLPPDLPARGTHRKTGARPGPRRGHRLRPRGVITICPISLPHLWAARGKWPRYCG